MKVNNMNNLLTAGKKVALMVLLTVMIASCGQPDDNVTLNRKDAWKYYLGLGLFGAGMYGMGFAAGRKGRDKEYE